MDHKLRARYASDRSGTFFEITVRSKILEETTKSRNPKQIPSFVSVIATNESDHSRGHIYYSSNLKKHNNFSIQAAYAIFEKTFTKPKPVSGSKKKILFWFCSKKVCQLNLFRLQKGNHIEKFWMQASKFVCEIATFSFTFSFFKTKLVRA